MLKLLFVVNQSATTRPPDAYAYCRNFGFVLDTRVSMGGVRHIYNSRNFNFVLDYDPDKIGDIIYNSRNFSFVLDISCIYINPK